MSPITAAAETNQLIELLSSMDTQPEDWNHDSSPSHCDEKAKSFFLVSFFTPLSSFFTVVLVCVQGGVCTRTAATDHRISPLCYGLHGWARGNCYQRYQSYRRWDPSGIWCTRTRERASWNLAGNLVCIAVLGILDPFPPLGEISTMPIGWPERVCYFHSKGCDHITELTRNERQKFR